MQQTLELVGLTRNAVSLPISALAPGLRMNITLFSYAGKLHFGIVGTQDMKDLDTLVQYMEGEFQNTESAVFESSQRIQAKGAGGMPKTGFEPELSQTSVRD